VSSGQVVQKGDNLAKKAFILLDAGKVPLPGQKPLKWRAAWPEGHLPPVPGSVYRAFRFESGLSAQMASLISSSCQDHRAFPGQP